MPKGFGSSKDPGTGKQSGATGNSNPLGGGAGKTGRFTSPQNPKSK